MVEKESEERKSRVVAYCRCSTLKQTGPEHQEDAIIKYCNEKNLILTEKIISETLSTKNDLFVILDSLLSQLNTGDILIIAELSRLGRKMSQLSLKVNNLLDRGVIIHLVNQKVVLEKNKGLSQVDINSIYLFAFSLATELETKFLSERTKSGLAYAKGNGKTLGRPCGKSKLDKYYETILEYKHRGFNATIISKELFRDHNVKCSVATIQRFIRKKQITKIV